MPSFPPLDGPGDSRTPFSCRWRDEGAAAASIQVAGELDLATSGQLAGALREALGSARLLLLDVREVAFMDCIGLHAILDATAAARARGGRLVVSGASPEIERLLELAGVREHLDVLPVPGDTAEAAPAQDGDSARPLDNPVNARVVSARVVAASEGTLWLRAADGPILRPWAPPTDRVAVPIGTRLEVYLDGAGRVNGWQEPESGLAINQRGLGHGGSPVTYADLACQGSCGLVWHAPAPDQLTERGERCLTCAGPLALT